MLPATNSSQRQRWSRLFAQFLSGQIVVQFLNLLIGFFLMRWLSKLEFAQFGLAFAFQSTLSSLVDLGFSGSVVALVGGNKEDRGVVGHYIKAALKLRARLSVVGIIVSCVVFPFITLRQGWSVGATLVLLGAIVATVLLQSQMIYSAPLLIYGHLKPYYRSQILASVSRLLLTLGLHILGMLSAATAACAVTLSTFINGILYRRNASTLFEGSQGDTREYTQNMVRYLSPMLPTIVFSTLQNQVVMALAAWFGKTANIAEVAALGRLGQLFIVLGAFNSVVVQPYIASVSQENLVLRYFQILTGAVFVAAFLGIIGFVFPAPFLWILGKNYEGLQLEVSLSIVAGCLLYVAGVIFAMNSARKWIFWWSTIFEIALLIFIDILCVQFVDLTTTIGLVQFSIITGCTFLIVHVANGVYGLIHRHRLDGIT